MKYGVRIHVPYGIPSRSGHLYTKEAVRNSIDKISESNISIIRTYGDVETLVGMSSGSFLVDDNELIKAFIADIEIDCSEAPDTEILDMDDRSVYQYVKDVFGYDSPVTDISLIILK